MCMALYWPELDFVVSEDTEEKQQIEDDNNNWRAKAQNYPEITEEE